MKLWLSLLISAACVPSFAQQLNNTEKSLACDESRERSQNDRYQACEMREMTASAGAVLTVDGRTNGGISIKGAQRSDILVRAKLSTWAPGMQEARSIAGQVNVQATGSVVRADAPDFGQDRGWSVSYEIFVPHQTSLTLTANNGGISIADVSGQIHFEAKNGGVTLKRLAGDVSGCTKNGGVKVELAGPRWDGRQLDVCTTNGGVSLDVPDSYSARLETSTVNGRVSIDFPVVLPAGQMTAGRELSVNLGSGGALIRAVTQNGGISVRKRS